MASGHPTPCPMCGRTFSGGELFCPYDRTPLPQPAAPTTDPLLNAVVNGSYTIVSRLGAGGMGVVYKAVQNRLDRNVALKILSPRFSEDPAAADRFRIEARAASQLTNGHTVIVHDFGAMEDGSLYIAMQLLEGEALRERVQRGPMPVREAVTVAMHVAESLSEAHEKPRPIVHRDIKPDNVFVRDNPDGEVHAWVLDFGLARFADSQRVRLTATNQVMGTPAYMAPEQCRGVQEIGPKADLYAVGVLMFEMLTGQKPFVGEDPTSLLFKHVYDAPPKLREVLPDIKTPPALDKLIYEMLEKSPDDRPASAAEVRSRLLDIHSTLARPTPRSNVSLESTVPLANVPTRAPTPRRATSPQPTIGSDVSSRTPRSRTTRPPGPTPPAPPPSRSSMTYVIGLIVLIVLGVAAGGYFLSAHRKTGEAEAAPVAVQTPPPAPAPAPAPAPPPVVAVAPPPPPPVIPAVAAPAPKPVVAVDPPPAAKHHAHKRADDDDDQPLSNDQRHKLDW